MLPHVEDLAVFLREIDAAPAHLVGNSWGAFISLLTAIRHPQLVRTLVLEEPPVISLLVKHTPPSPIDVLRLLVTRPRTAIELLRLVATVFVPVQKAFRRGDDEKALELFAKGVAGEEAFQHTPRRAGRSRARTSPRSRPSFLERDFHSWQMTKCAACIHRCC